MDAARESHLRETASQGDVIRDWLKSEGGKLMRRKVDELTGKMHTRWMLASKEEAEKIRDEARGYEQIFALAKKIILEGDAAKKQLEQDKANL